MSDTTKRIIYKQDDGRVAVIVPAKNEARTVEEIAKKEPTEGEPIDDALEKEKPEAEKLPNPDQEKQANKILKKIKY